MAEYITVAEAAKRLSVSRQAIYNWVEEGRIQGVVKVSHGNRRSTVRLPSDFHLQLLAQQPEAVNQ